MTKKNLLLVIVVLMMVGCSTESQDEPEVKNEKTVVKLQFTPYEMESMTRAATSIADYCSHLDVWLAEGENVIEAHQSSGDAGFGTLTLTLDKTKTYTMYAVAHKCTSDATLADGVISFPDDKVTHTMYYSTTFSPETTTELSCLMERIVALFRLQTSDAVPADAKKMRFTLRNVYNRWNVTTGGVNELDREVTIDITSTQNDGTVAFSVYAITTSEQTLHTVVVEALNQNDEVVQTRTFENVPLRNGYKTTYRGAFFIDEEMSMTFTADDWNEYDVIDF